MDHPLDRPAWSALTSRQAYLVRGEGQALRYDGDHAIFAETPDDTTACTFCEKAASGTQLVYI